VKEFQPNSVKMVNDWQDDPETEQVSYDCMEMIAPGTFYHHRLNKIFIVRSMAFPNDKVS
jgi:hypothetical protein